MTKKDPTPKEIAKYFFQSADESLYGKNRWVCRFCPAPPTEEDLPVDAEKRKSALDGAKNVRMCDTRKGYTNLAAHVKSGHPNWQAIMSHSEPTGLESWLSVTPKAINIFGWLDWIIMDNLPFSFVENPLTRKYTNLKPICTNTFMKYMEDLCKEVERVVAKKLPDRFGLALDGWGHGSSHFVALVACCPGNEKFLLAFSVFEDETDFSSSNHGKFIESVLDLFGKSVANVLFLCGDNVAVNKRLAREDLRVPFIGCASHRLNLAVNQYLQEFEPQLDQINTLMKKLNNYTKAGALRKLIDKSPVTRNKTRWTSTFHMLERYTELYDAHALDAFAGDAEIGPLLFKPSDHLKLKDLFGNLKKINGVVIYIQKEDITLSEVNNIFSKLVASYPIMADKIGKKNTIAADPEFESAIVKIMNGKEIDLDPSEKKSVRRLKLELQDDIDNIMREVQAQECENEFLSEVITKKPRVTPTNSSQYLDLSFIPPTTDMVERLFSAAGLVMTDLRGSMEPYTLEQVMFLKYNRKLWNLETVAKLV